MPEQHTFFDVERPTSSAYLRGMRRIRCTLRRAAEKVDAKPHVDASAGRGSLRQPVSSEDDLEWFVGRARAGSDTEERAAQAWLDVLPSELS
jgi:hypothetical protein